MKNNDIDNLKVTCLSNDEMCQIDGGVVGIDDIIVGVVVWVACEVIEGCARYASGERRR